AEFDHGNTDFETGLQKWIDSLGEIRAARFFVLPGDRIRYEIASPGAYRVGVWNQRWENGSLRFFAPIEENLTTTVASLFQDITSEVFANVASFDQQLRIGIPAWRARLDSASGIDVHGHNGLAVGDIDGD